MEEHRTFGVELELTSTKTREQLADIVQQAFQANNSLHTIIATGYVQCRDGNNFSRWIAKTDGSIRCGIHPGYDYGIELVSPVLRGEAGLEQLKIVCEAIKPYVKVNKSCGLHVHHGMQPEDNLGNILMAWARSEKVIYECLPVSRKTGTYAAPVARHIGTDSPPSATNRSEFKRWTERKLPGRFWGLNLASLWIRNTMEVRCAAGTHEFSKIANWVRVTQRLIVKGSIAPDVFTHTSSIQDFIIGLEQGLELAERTELVNRAVESVVQGNARWLPRTTTRSGYAFYRLLEATEMVDRYSLVRECRDRFGSTTAQAEIYVSDAISILARRAGLQVLRYGNGRRLRITYPSTTEINYRTEPVTYPAVSLDAANTPADQDAFAWLRERHEKFVPLHRAAGF